MPGCGTGAAEDTGTATGWICGVAVEFPLLNRPATPTDGAAEAAEDAGVDADRAATACAGAPGLDAVADAPVDRWRPS